MIEVFRSLNNILTPSLPSGGASEQALVPGTRSSAQHRVVSPRGLWVPRSPFVAGVPAMALAPAHGLFVRARVRRANLTPSAAERGAWF